MENNEKEIASILLKIKAVHLRPDNPFTWTSGIKSPIYCDNRQIISYPEHRKKVAKSFAERIQKNYPDTQLIAGTATAGIPHAAWVADILNLPMVYVRSSSKGHGLENLIEGHFEKGQKTVLIEDLISTGKSSIAAAKALEEQELPVQEVMAIFSYQTQKSEDLFADAGLKYSTLSGIETLLETAEAEKYISAEQAERVRQWKIRL